MTNTQLQGQVFNCKGVNYLVLEDNDWSAERLRVKRIDNTRAITEMAIENILESLAGGLTRAKPALR